MAAARRPRVAIVAALVLGLAACGFQLRGSYGIDDDLMPMRVDAGGELGRALRDGFAASGIELTDSPESAHSTLRVLNSERERRIIAIGQDGNVDEFELLYDVRWRLDRSDGDGGTQALVEPTTNRVRRNFIFDPDRRLAADEEEEALVEQLFRDMTDRILRRIEAWPSADPAGAE